MLNIGFFEPNFYGTVTKSPFFRCALRARNGSAASFGGAKQRCPAQKVFARNTIKARTCKPILHILRLTYIRALRTLASFFTRKRTASGPEARWDLLVTAGKELLAA